MFQVDANRYANMQYRRVGNTGLKLPVISLGLAYNFSESDYEKSKEIIERAFNMGINHFDLSVAFGDKPGAVEKLFGRVLKEDLNPYRKEIVISTKVCKTSNDIPTGCLASRKNIVQSLEESLKRLNTNYVDILYIDGYDEETPLEETVMTLKNLVDQGKILYAGVCNFTALQVKKIGEIFKKYDCPFIGNMVEYNIFNRKIETEKMIDLVSPYGATIAYRPLAEGLLSNKYIKDAPYDSRANKPGVGSLTAQNIGVEITAKLSKLNQVAAKRAQSISQLAISWVLRNEQIPTVVLGASRISQLTENIGALSKLVYEANDLKTIDKETK